MAVGADEWPVTVRLPALERPVDVTNPGDAIFDHPDRFGDGSEFEAERGEPWCVSHDDWRRVQTFDEVVTRSRVAAVVCSAMTTST